MLPMGHGLRVSQWSCASAGICALFGRKRSPPETQMVGRNRMQAHAKKGSKERWECLIGPKDHASEPTLHQDDKGKPPLALHCQPSGHCPLQRTRSKWERSDGWQAPVLSLMRRAGRALSHPARGNRGESELARSPLGRYCHGGLLLNREAAAMPCRDGPTGWAQVSSSRNPMVSVRLCSLSLLGHLHSECFVGHYATA